MNGPQHFRQSERMAARVERGMGDGNVSIERANGMRIELALAQIHATLALAAATVNPRAPFEEWEKVLR